ncbi:MAG: DUF2189 domain-containing protein [Alphaproteobacteria bacterium]|nr:DUF2189 domain-containing protein [Alphaproteobacteria bacterium]MDX5369782.1 DUF2189 domain-containing protein [Alphaproteobacteria bacterium]MDX5464406.1 DUF2189 domain-containing protein [Alphaproteobacteria bacterium]
MSSLESSMPGRMATVATLPGDAPWGWLAAGWRDLWTQPVLSIGYGLVFTIASFVILYGLVWSDIASLFLALAGGLLLLGPMLAVGLYEKSRRLAGGEQLSAGVITLVKTRSPVSLAFFGVVLLLAYFFWMRVAYLLFALFFSGTGFPPMSEFVPTLLFTTHGLGLLVVGTGVGAVFAAVVFAMSVVSVPMMVSREVDTLTAVVTSIQAVVRNPAPMLLWAVIVAAIMALGVATFFIGLAVAFPLVGHATWHAYKATVH